MNPWIIFAIVAVLLLVIVVVLCKISYLQGWRDCARQPRLSLLNPELTTDETAPTRRTRTRPTP